MLVCLAKMSSATLHSLLDVFRSPLSQSYEDLQPGFFKNMDFRDVPASSLAICVLVSLQSA